MGTYLMMLYVSLEQEQAVKKLFTNKGWGFKKPDLRMTTDDIGPLTDDLSDGENDTSAKRGVSTRRSVAAKKSKPTPVRKGEKNKPKQKKKKTTKESAEFQEIVEEAELITESINELENDQMKMEAGSDHVYEGDDYDVFDDFSDDGDNDMTPSTSDVSPSKDVSAFTTPRPSKKRKLDATDESASTSKGSIKGTRGSYMKAYSQNDLDEAVKAVREGGMKTLGAARLFSVPESTLRDKLEGVTSDPDPETMLSKQEESLLAELILTLGKLGHKHTKQRIIQLATDYCVSLKKRSADQKSLTARWGEGFIKRWPVLKDLINNSSVSIGETISYYYTEVENMIKQYELDKKPNLIYNVTDIVITKKDLAKRGQKKMVTLFACGNAEGEVIPPFFVFHHTGKQALDELLPKSYPGSTGVLSKDLEMDFQMFFDFLEHFVRNIQTDLQKETILLVVDGNKLCASVTLMEWAESKNIILLFTPAKVKQAVQPLDLQCIDPFQELYQGQCQDMGLQSSPDVDLNTVGDLVCSVYGKAFSHDNLTEGFRKTGLFPLDKNALMIDEEKGEIILKA